MSDYYDHYLGRTVRDEARREREIEILGYDPRCPPAPKQGDEKEVACPGCSGQSDSSDVEPGTCPDCV